MKMDAIEIVGELDAVGHETQRRSCEDNGVLVAKVKEFLVDEFYEKYLTALEESVEANRTNEQIFDDDFTDANVDPQYKLFLDNIREVGNMFVVEFNASDGVSSCLTYEADDGTHDISPVNMVGNRKGRAVGNGKSLPVSRASKRSRSETVREDQTLRGRQSAELRTSRTVPVVGAGYAQQSKRDVRRGRRISVAKKNTELKAKSCGPYQRKSGSRRQQNPDAFSLESRKNTTAESKVIEDESYKAYLMWMVQRNEDSETIPEKVIEVKREIDTESSFGSDIIAIGDNPFSDEDYSPFVPSRNCDVVDIDGKDTRPHGVYNSWFRKKLMNILRKPYSRTEFRKLYRDVSIRNFVTRDRELRDGREISYKTDILRDSYLDKHPDFRELFVPPWGDETTDLDDLMTLPIWDRYRALNLLRGFVFYLQNVVHDGAFKPWLDSECLRTMPSQW